MVRPLVSRKSYPWEHPSMSIPMAIHTKHKIIFPKHMRWVHRCQFLLLTFYFQLVRSTKSISLTMCEQGGTVVRTLRILVFNQQCLCIHSFKHPAAQFFSLYSLPSNPLRPPSTSVKSCASIQSSLALFSLMTSWSEPCVTFSFV